MKPTWRGILFFTIMCSVYGSSAGRRCAKGDGAVADFVAPLLAGGPLKPGFGLSGAEESADTFSLLPVLAGTLSIPTQSPPLRRSLSGNAESCSRASLPDAPPAPALPDYGACIATCS